MAEEIKESTDDEVVEDINSSIRELNKRLAVAGERGMLINIDMVVLNGKTFPSFRLAEAYKRVDKPLILRA